MKVGYRQKKKIHESMEGYDVSKEYVDEMISLYEEGETEMASELLYWAISSEEYVHPEPEFNSNYSHEIPPMEEVQKSVRIRRIENSQKKEL